MKVAPHGAGHGEFGVRGEEPMKAQGRLRQSGAVSPAAARWSRASAVLAILLGLILSTTSARAQCAPDPASSGQTVTCSGTDADGFQAGAGVTNLTVNVLAGATVRDNGSVAIGLDDS